MNIASKPPCPKMIKIKAAFPQKSASSNARFRKRPTIGPLIPLVPLSHEVHEHHCGGYKRTCHGHCSKSKVQSKPEIKISELIFGKEGMKLPKIKKNFVNDPKFQENVLRDLLGMAEQKNLIKNRHLVDDIKVEIFRSFKFEKPKVDSIINYIDMILLATEKTKEDVKNTLDFMQETRDKCQKLDIQMEEFLEGVRDSLTSFKKDDYKIRQL